MKRFVFDVNSPPDLSRKKRLRHGDPALGKVNAKLDTLPEDLLIVNGTVQLEATLGFFPIKYMPGSYTYSLEYNGGDAACYKNELKPFLIRFHDGLTSEINDDCYISNFHKTCSYSGTQVIYTILKLLKCLQVRIVTLYDGSTINDGKISLSLVKLVELGRTFYNKFGFRRMFMYHLPMHFGTKKNLEIRFEKALEEVLTIDIDDIITYHQELFYALSGLLRGVDISSLSQIERAQLVIGKDEISYYVDLQGEKHADGIRLFDALSILKTSLDVLSLRAFDQKTLHEVVVQSVKSQDSQTLSNLLNIDMLPEVFKLKKSKTAIRGKFLESLAILSDLSGGKMLMDLRKTRMSDLS